MGGWWMMLWLASVQIQPIAEETWVTIPEASIAYQPQAAALNLFWQGEQYPAEQVDRVERGWRAKFHVRADQTARLQFDDTLPADNSQSARSTSQGPTACYRVQGARDTLWRIGNQLAGPGQDPYLYVLALFAANRDVLDNNPRNLRVGLVLQCPTVEHMARLSAMSPNERRVMFHRLMGYAERLSRS